ncbi:hypothetical protein QFC21_001988 [Naganishia friedmannii]|uniref:Uncharacterized protein n=1 Tax=Naganishia friedmannii TaxID=89922 RepID=A0ACC2W1G6_9TREE|nr:hypothetical protein QFC21_001988 [Naganishia friedmannii]
MSTAAPQSFRSQLSSFRWANSVQDDSAATPAASGNPLSRAYNSITSSVSDYVPLRSSLRSDEEEAYFALSCKKPGVSWCSVPTPDPVQLSYEIVAFKPRKFVMAFTLGSLLFMAGFAVLQGPLNHLKHIMSKERLPFSIAYFGSLALTLYFSLGVAALLTYLAAYFPGGITTLRYGGQMGKFIFVRSPDRTEVEY